jgi:stage V sporulation protein B
VFLCAVRFSLAVGGALALFTYLFAGVITKYLMSTELAVYALRVLAPAIFISAIIGTFRGYFQGYSTMVPTAVSQIIEQIVNAVVTVVCAGIMYSYGVSLAESSGNESLGPAWGAAGGTFGTVASITIALLFMMLVYTAQKKTLQRNIRRDQNGRKESEAVIYRLLILTILPVILSTVIYNISNVADQGVFNRVLLGQGYTPAQYNSIWGIYSGKFRVLMNVPLALASCMAPAIVPSLTAAMAQKNRKEARSKISTSIRFTMLLTIPCAAGMAVLARPILTMLFHQDTGVALAEGIMRAGALMIILYALSTLTTGILQGLGQLRQPLINCSISLVLHFILLYILLTTFNLNIYAVVYANIFFALVVCVLNARAIHRFINYRQEWYRTFVVPTLASLIMSAVVAIVYYGLHAFLGNTVSTLVSIIAGAMVYCLGMVGLHGITIEELAEFPKGYLLIRILRKMGLIR